MKIMLSRAQRNRAGTSHQPIKGLVKDSRALCFSYVAERASKAVDSRVDNAIYGGRVGLL